jgi:predicted transcriptional regulator
MKNRDRFEIFSLILQIANGGNNATATRIMNRALLSYKQMKEHLMFLTQKELLCHDNVNGTFMTTEKGIRFLEIYGRMEDMIRLQQEQKQTQERRLWGGPLPNQLQQRLWM